MGVIHYVASVGREDAQQLLESVPIKTTYYLSVFYLLLHIYLYQVYYNKVDMYLLRCVYMQHILNKLRLNTKTVKWRGLTTGCISIV
jgi:hypothetical protein